MAPKQLFRELQKETSLLHVCSDSTATLFGIAGLDVLEVVEDQAGVTVLVQTPEELTGCAGCGVVATGNGRRRQVFRDVPRGSTPVRVVWSKRRWRCGESDCLVRIWTDCLPRAAGSCIVDGTGPELELWQSRAGRAHGCGGGPGFGRVLAHRDGRSTSAWQASGR